MNTASALLGGATPVAAAAAAGGSFTTAATAKPVSPHAQAVLFPMTLLPWQPRDMTAGRYMCAVCQLVEK